MDQPIDQLYEQLKAAGKIGTIPPKTFPRGVPSDFDYQAFCSYHSGSPGHSTVNCWALKHKVQDLIEIGAIILKREAGQGPNVNKNLFSGGQGFGKI